MACYWFVITTRFEERMKLKQKVEYFFQYTSLDKIQRIVEMNIIILNMMQKLGCFSSTFWGGWRTLTSLFPNDFWLIYFRGGGWISNPTFEFCISRTDGTFVVFLHSKIFIMKTNYCLGYWKCRGPQNIYIGISCWLMFFFCKIILYHLEYRFSSPSQNRIWNFTR